MFAVVLRFAAEATSVARNSPLFVTRLSWRSVWINRWLFMAREAFDDERSLVASGRLN